MRATLITSTIFSVFAGLSASAVSAQGVEGYYVHPDAHDDVLVFASEGDLWRAPRAGGEAVRLTTHEEIENHPQISPDGTQIAFMASYDDERVIYVMPIAGGRPKPITFEGAGVALIGWAPDGRVLYSSTNEPGNNSRVLRLVSPENGDVETLPLWRAREATFSDDGRTLFFVRRGLAESNDNALLYRGGAMAELWRWRLGSNREARRMAADFDAPIRNPMAANGRIYFLSDKDGADAIWSVNEQGRDAKKHTEGGAFQLRNPSLADGAILYQKGADLYAFDLDDETETKIEVTLLSDRDQTRTRFIENGVNYLEDARITTGGAVAVTARGDAALAFTGERRRIDFDIPAGARARAAVPGVDGDWVYMILDQNRRGEIWRFPADGRGEPEQLTVGSDAMIWEIIPSPDGERLVFDDKKGRLWSLDLESQEKTLLAEVETGDDSPFSGITFSKHGRYLAYSEFNASGVNDVWVQDLTTGERVRADRPKFSGYSPAFSDDGAWLYFLSDRTFTATPGSPWGNRNMGAAFMERGKVYAVQLDPDAAFPFTRENELTAAKDEDADEADETEAPEEADETDDAASESEAEAADEGDAKADEETEDEKKETDPDIVFEGLEERLFEVPVGRGDYYAVSANAKFLYLLQDADNGADLKSVAINAKKPEVKTFAKNVRSFDLSQDGETMYYRSGDTLALVPAGTEAPGDLSDRTARISDWRLEVDPRTEWRQMLHDAWRMHKAYSFDPAMRGVDWEGVLERYAPLVARIGHRSELDDLLGQMSANLGILHSQIRGGDVPSDDEGGAVAFLGARYETVSDGLRIAELYDTEADLLDDRGPLTRPGVDVAVGDVLTAVDGAPVASLADLRAALNRKAGTEVRLDLLRDGEEHSEIVKPVNAGGRFWLLYHDWVEGRREYVREKTDDRFGYLHLRAMGGGDAASFARDFFPMTQKDGIIIDVRGNWGGNIDSMLLTQLMRKAWAFWRNPNGGEPYPNMQGAFRGHLVVLIDEGTYSDGETFTAGFKALDLGAVVGQRTAGAGIWLSGRNRLVDGGMARIAEFPQYGLDGRWLIEGRGVSPTIDVDNPPYATFMGEDAQMDAAIAYLEEKLREEPIEPLEAKPLPPFGQWGEDVK